MKFIDLFCGIGGFHQALKKFNTRCVLASDNDKKCQEIYKKNYNIDVQNDVKKINPNDIEDFDIICGGFPCQTFSNAGKKNTFSDKRGLLFDEIIRIAKVKKPKFIFLENVKHILKVGDGKVIKYIKEQLDENNYILQLFNMSPHKYGIPQQRERIYFVCIRKDIYNGLDIEIPISNKKIIFNNFFDKKKDIDKKYYIKGDILKVLEAWDEMIKIFEVGEKISPTILIHEFYIDDRKKKFDTYPKWKQNYINSNKKIIDKYKDKWDSWYKKHKDILQKREIYGKLEWQTGLIKPNDSIFNYFIQIRQSGIRVKKAEYFPTLVAISQIPIYGKEKRYITPRECARLQSFPEDFIMSENDNVSYKQFGNAVNVDNVETVIKATFQHYNILF
jgi:DNA (cytosine-5)-methyltransferase 1